MISVIIIIIFGFVRSSGYPFLALYFSFYIIYIILSVVLDRMSPEEETEEEILDEES